MFPAQRMKPKLRSNDRALFHDAFFGACNEYIVVHGYQVIEERTGHVVTTFPCRVILHVGTHFSVNGLSIRVL